LSQVKESATVAVALNGRAARGATGGEKGHRSDDRASNGSRARIGTFNEEDEMSEARKSVAIVIAGSGGTGAITAGSAILAAAARDGHYGLMTKLSGAQVRGGEAAALLEIGSSAEGGAIEAQPDRFDCLIALDWQDVHRFAPEIPLDRDSIIVCDPKNGAVPEAIARSGARVV